MTTTSTIGVSIVMSKWSHTFLSLYLPACCLYQWMYIWFPSRMYDYRVLVYISWVKNHARTANIRHRVKTMIDWLDFLPLSWEMDNLIKIFLFCLIFRLFQRLTLDTIADCGFGMNTNALINNDDECIKNCRGVIRDTTKRPILFMLGCTYSNFPAF